MRIFAKVAKVVQQNNGFLGVLMLEELAFEIVRKDENELRTIGIGIAILGFVVALIVQSRAKSELQRAPYFAYSMLLLLISSVLTFMWLSSMQAILLGILWVLVGAIFLGIAVIGYFFGVFALARSRDAYGHGRYAILAFIPLANLVLLLKRSKNVFSINRIPTIPLLSGGVGVTVGIMMGAASMVLSSSFQMQADGMVENADVEDNIPFLIQSLGLEETLKLIAAAAEIQLPIVIDEATTLTSTVADGNRLLHTFVVAIDDVTLNDQHRSTIEQYVCADEMMISLLRIGATIEEVFIKADGSAIGSIVVTQDECGP